MCSRPQSLPRCSSHLSLQQAASHVTLNETHQHRWHPPRQQQEFTLRQLAPLSTATWSRFIPVCSTPCSSTPLQVSCAAPSPSPPCPQIFLQLPSPLQLSLHCYPRRHFPSRRCTLPNFLQFFFCGLFS
jgi:hypothetical protein